MGRQRQRRAPIRRTFGLLILIVTVFGTSTLHAQAPEIRALRMLAGRSTVVEVGVPIARVSLTSADVADVLVTAPGELLVNAKAPGTISMFVWERGGAIRRYEVVVQRDLGRLAEQVKELFPAESVEVQSNGKNAVLSGTVSSKDVADKMVSLASGWVDSKDNVISLLQIQEGAPSNQVLLRVRFAEVSRSAMTELGVGFFTSPTGINNTIGRVTTGQFPAPNFDELKSTKASSEFGSEVTSASGKFTFSDFLNLFLYNEKFDLGMVVKALQTRGLFESLAEPNLVAESGKEASFLAGGEFPIPVPQASGSGTSITVQFKEFGIRLSFTPTVIGNRIHLKVKPEVSTLDFNNAITLNGFRIPALTTRRTETELELNNNQTFAIAGLINNSMISTMQKVPGLGDIPILGLLFRSKAAQKDQTELVVMITPEILPNNARGVTPNLPRLVEPYLPPLPQNRTLDPPPPSYGSVQPIAPVTTVIPPPVPAPGVIAPGTTASTSPAAAAATVQALTPNTRMAQPQPVAPAATPAAPAAAPVPAVTRPLNDAEKKVLERAHKEEQKQRAISVQQMAERDREQARLARLQSVRNAQQAKIQAAQAKKDAEVTRKVQAAAAKRAAEQAKKEAEAEKRRQQAVNEAEARIKAAQAAYQAEVQKSRKP